MTIFETYGKEIVALVVPFITWVLTTFFRSKARLFIGNPHTFTFLVAQPLLAPNGNQIAPQQTVHTRSHVIWNGGREKATKVELVFNWKPLCLNVWPSRHYQEHTESDGRYVVIFESLAPNEVFGCELMSINQDLPALVTLRSDECIAQTVNMYPQPFVSQARRRVRAGLQLAGIALLVYYTIVLIQYLVLKTPIGK